MGVAFTLGFSGSECFLLDLDFLLFLEGEQTMSDTEEVVEEYE